MELTKFLETILESDYQSVQMFSALIETSTANEKNEQAILEFFESIPQQYRDNKKTYEQAFYLFFQEYQINEKNVKYYHDFIEQNVIKIDIIEKNPHWKFDKTIFEYKTLKDLLLNFGVARSKHNDDEEGEGIENEGMAFFNENFASFEKFRKASVKKFTQALIKKDVFRFFQVIGYNQFKDVCERLSLNYLDVLKEEYIKPYSENYEGYGFRAFFTYTMYRDMKNEDMVSVLTDLTENREYLFGTENQFLTWTNKNYSRNENHIGLVFLSYVNHGRFDLATTMVNFFEKEVLECISNYQYPKKSVTLDKESLTNALSWLSDEGRRNGAFHQFAYFREEEVDNFLKFYASLTKEKNQTDEAKAVKLKK
jgi:hypothetical protein